jgi:hypothetical protein
MPYISQEKRKELDSKMKDVLKIAYDLTEGELNYIISNLINSHLEGNDINYSLLNGMIGVLESAKLELYNRMVGLYETQKIIQNGGLYKPENSMRLANEIDKLSVKIDAYETSERINTYNKKITFDYKDKVSELKKELDELKQAFQTNILI